MLSLKSIFSSILYQRGIYPVEAFKQVPKYGLNMLVTSDDKLEAFFVKFLKQLSGTFTNMDFCFEFAVL
jgi:hypothetical protein